MGEPVSDSDHRRLEATVFPDQCVVESLLVSDASRGLRKVPVTRVWRTERVLGRGGFAEVHLQSQDADKDSKRALKIISTRGTKMSIDECKRELMALIEFTKPKYKDAAVFVDFIGWFQNDDAIFLAMEYMPLGDLEQNMLQIEKSATNTGPFLPEEEAQEITRQILEGLKIMHTEGFAHRDLKPQNIFVVQKYPQWWVKLGDFGLSKKRSEWTAYRTHAGTQQYMAPELFYYVQELDTETSEYTNAIDLWALGCIVYRILTGAVPFPSLLSLRNYCRDSSRLLPNLPPDIGVANNFVRGLLIPHPAQRPLASAALESTWLTTKNNPRIVAENIETKFAATNISLSSNDYNTGTHKGLQSFNSWSGGEDTTSDVPTIRPAAAPAPLRIRKSVPKAQEVQPQLAQPDSNEQNPTLRINNPEPLPTHVREKEGSSAPNPTSTRPNNVEVFELSKPFDEKVIHERFLALVYERGWHNLPEQARRQMMAYPAAKKWTLIYQNELTKWQAGQKKKTTAQQTGQSSSARQVLANSDEMGSPDWFIQRILDSAVTEAQLQSLAVSLRTQPIGWVKRFIELQGPGALARTLNETNQRGEEDVDREYDIVKCMKALMNNKYGADYACDQQQVIVSLVYCLTSSRLTTRKLVSEILTFLCYWADGQGHVRVLQAMDYAKDQLRENGRFDAWMRIVEVSIDGRGKQGVLNGGGANSRENIAIGMENLLMEYAVATLFLINMVIDTPRDLQLRVHIRSQLIACGVRRILMKMEKFEYDILDKQIERFRANESIDYEHLLDPQF